MTIDRAVSEPTTAAGRYLYFGNAVKGAERAFLNAILAIESEARAQGVREERERLRAAVLVHCARLDWHQGICIAYGPDEPKP